MDTSRRSLIKCSVLSESDAHALLFSEGNGKATSQSFNRLQYSDDYFVDNHLLHMIENPNVLLSFSEGKR